MRRAKIVCTLGPSTDTYEKVLELARSGMNVARLNLSHGTHADHEKMYELVRRAAAELDRGIGILADIQGPKIRLGVFATGPVRLEREAEFVITTEPVMGTAARASTTYEGLPQDVAPGDKILVDDGKVTLEVQSVVDRVVHTRVVEPGLVSDHKGLNLPGVKVGAPVLTEKDVEDLRWALRTGVDLIALSFVRSARDIEAVHAVMDDEGRRLPVFAKIEKPEAVAELEDIIRSFDGIMVARGDLGVELPLEAVPLEQKRAIDLCRIAAKPVIVATQMLESMTTSSRPTRAEASDVANAVLDGADALMLSGETSIGRDPNLVVRTMSDIITYIEQHALDRIPRIPKKAKGDTGKALARAAVMVAEAVEAKFIVAFTENGGAARTIARHRPSIPLIGVTPNQSTLNLLSVVWGVDAYLTDSVTHTDNLVETVDSGLIKYGQAVPGDKVVIVAGVPPGVSGSTNGMRVHVIGQQDTTLADGPGLLKTTGAPASDPDPDEAQPDQ